MALNENKEEFSGGSVIDVYDLSTNHYSFSFYLRAARNEKVKGLMVKGGMLYAIYDHAVQRYALDRKFFPSHD